MVESVGNAPTSACLQGKCIACLPRPLKLARRLGAAPGKLSFGDSAAQAGARLMRNDLVRLPGIAPGLPPWREGILLLNHNRGN